MNFVFFATFELFLEIWSFPVAFRTVLGTVFCLPSWHIFTCFLGFFLLFGLFSTAFGVFLTVFGLVLTTFQPHFACFSVFSCPVLKIFENAKPYQDGENFKGYIEKANTNK